MHLLVGQAELGCRNLLLFWKKVLVSLCRRLSPFLRRIIFVRKPTLCLTRKRNSPQP